MTICGKDAAEKRPQRIQSGLRSARVRPRPARSCSLTLGSGLQLRASVPRGSSVGPERNESGLGLQVVAKLFST